MLAPDSVLHEHYRITYVADERPDCVIYRAVDQRDSRRVLIAAIVETSAEALNHSQSLAQQVAGVEAAGLLPLRHHFSDQMTLYLVADDPGGQDLERFVRERGMPLPEATVLQIVERLLDTVETLHSRKTPLLLGDLRTTDLWASPGGELLLAPFAVARGIGSEPSPYRAPELDDHRNEPTTSSDLYAIGAVVYQLLTGWAPPAATLRKSGTPLNSPRTLNAQISTLTEQLVLRALEMRPANRYQLAREMRRAMDMVRMMAGRPLGAEAPLTTQQTPVIQPPPVVLPPAEPPLQPPYASPGQPQARPPSGQQQPPVPPVAPLPPAYPPQYAGYPVAAAPPQPAPRQSNTCLIIAVVVLAVLALAICAMLGLLLLNPTFRSLIGQAVPPSSPPLIATTAPTTTGSGQISLPPTAAPVTPTAASTPALDPDAITIASAAAITATDHLTGTLVGPVIYSPDGALLLIGNGPLIEVRAAAGLQEQRVLKGHTGVVGTLAMAPLTDTGVGPLLLASGAIDENAIRLWDVEAGRQLRALEGHTGWIRSLAFSPNGALLASGSTDNTVRLWDPASGRLLRTLEGHTNWLGNIAFSPDGALLASGSRDGTVRLWDVATGSPRPGFSFAAPLNPDTGASYWVTGVAFSPDGAQIAVGTTDTRVYLLDAATGATRQTLSGHTDWVVIRGTAFSPDGKTLATASLDGTVRLWNTSSGAASGTLERRGLQILGISWSPDGNFLAASSDHGGEVVVWDVARGEVMQSLQVGQGLITALNYSGDNSILGAGGINGLVKLYLLAENRQVTIPGGAPASQYLAFLDDSKLVAISDAGSVVLLDLTQREQPRTLAGLDGLAYSVAVSSDRSVIAAGTTDGRVVLWDSATRQRLRIFEGLDGVVQSLAFSADGRRLAASSGANAPRIVVWSMRDGSIEHTFDGHSSAITGMAVQPNGRILVSASRDGSLRFWDIQNGAEIRQINAPPEQGWFSGAAFSPDGTLLATGSLAGTIQFWDPGTGDLLHSLNLGAGGVLALAFRDDGRQLAVSTRDGGVWLLAKG